jgi:hypothetical protein
VVLFKVSNLDIKIPATVEFTFVPSFMSEIRGFHSGRMMKFFGL